jgi:hypothetical protein
MSYQDRLAVVFCGEQLSTSEKNLLRLLDFFGITSLKVAHNAASIPEILSARNGNPEYSLFATACCLAALSSPLSKLHPLFAGADSVFIYDFSDRAGSEQVLRFLASAPGAQMVYESPAIQSVVVSDGWPEFCGPMSGLKVSGVRGVTPHFLIPETAPFYLSLIECDQSPIFFRVMVDGKPVFATSAGIDVDINTPVKGSYFDIKDCFAGAVPVIMYLRWAFQGKLLTSNEHGACLVVDDPPLKKRYGFLVFEEALALAQRHRFAITLAFIPWNWRRTDASTAKLFLKHPDLLSLVVHGNDHTAAEFGAESVEALERKIATAVQRMKAHQVRVGIDWSPIMVFPQGVFSSESLAALQRNNFSAAVNTEVSPAGTDGAHTEVAELWSTAIMKFSAFPLFTRRYMGHGIENFAFDLLLGKPCLIAAHHDVFQHKAEALVKFLGALNSLNCSLKWRGLGELVRRSFRKRENSDGTTSVQMFANEMLLENKTSRNKTFNITRAESDAAKARMITANETSIDYCRDSSTLRFSVNVPPGGSVRVQVFYNGRQMDRMPAESLAYRAKCRARRALSEFRDDYVCRSVFLNQWTARIRRCLR